MKDLISQLRYDTYHNFLYFDQKCEVIQQCIYILYDSKNFINSLNQRIERDTELENYIFGSETEILRDK